MLAVSVYCYDPPHLSPLTDIIYVVRWTHRDFGTRSMSPPFHPSLAPEPSLPGRNFNQAQLCRRSDEEARERRQFGADVWGARHPRAVIVATRLYGGAIAGEGRRRAADDRGEAGRRAAVRGAGQAVRRA